MTKLYFTIAGMGYYYGENFLERGDEVKLVKEPDNKYDKEAIKVMVDGLGKIGYVANSTSTVLGECYSAGRLYDQIDDNVKAKVKYVTDRGTICEIKMK